MSLDTKRSVTSWSDLLMWTEKKNKMSWMLPSNHALILKPFFPDKESIHNIHTILSFVPSASAYSILMGSCVCLGTGCHQRAYA